MGLESRGERREVLSAYVELLDVKDLQLYVWSVGLNDKHEAQGDCSDFAGKSG